MATFSKSLTVAAKSAYSLVLNDIPVGASVTPVNDIQTWLHCADIWSKTYTNISQVLADAPTLQALIASNNATDYLVRSTNWASSVCANATAMGYIGNNNYCANKLLANNTWSNAICNSTYFESVLTAKVPTMTSATTPSGQVTASGTFDVYYPYMAFDNNANTNWIAMGSTVNPYIIYEFPNAVLVKKLQVKLNIYTNRAHTVEIYGSNDNVSYTKLLSYEPSATSDIQTKTAVLTNNTKYKYLKLTFTLYSAGNNISIHEVQYWGRT